LTICGHDVGVADATETDLKATAPPAIPGRPRGHAPTPASRDEEAVAHFVERFADLLVEAGMPRMPSRIFVRLMVTDSGRLSAAELAEHLQISPAAVSGGIRYLTQVEMVRRERPPGSRRDVYRVGQHPWHEALTQRDQLMLRWADSLRTGVDVLGETTEAGERIRESVEFFEFVAAELPLLMERWRTRKAR
jgi:DNA-binding transcriptional regulator GbsR (MarR family)